MADVVRLAHSTGVVVSVAAAKVDGLVAVGYVVAETDAPGDNDYSAMKVAELRVEIDRRNEGRDEADLIPDDGKKADLIAALELDDADTGDDEPDE